MPFFIIDEEICELQSTIDMLLELKGKQTNRLSYYTGYLLHLSNEIGLYQVMSSRYIKIEMHCLPKYSSRRKGMTYSYVIKGS